MNKTSYEKGFEKGIEMYAAAYEKGIAIGIEKSRRETLREVLEAKFGPLTPAVLPQLEQLPAERLRPLRLTMLKADSLDELGRAD